MNLQDLRQNDKIILKLKRISPFYNSFLDKFEANVISATNDEIIITSPVKNDSIKQWPIHIDEIELLQLEK